MNGGRTTAGVMTAEIGAAMHEARRRRDAAATIANRYTDAARTHTLAGLDAVWSSAEGEWSRYLAADPGVSESTVLEAFARIAPDAPSFG